MLTGNHRKGTLRYAFPDASPRFRGVLVSKAHRLLYYSTLGLRVIKKKKKKKHLRGKGI